MTLYAVETFDRDANKDFITETVESENFSVLPSGVAFFYDGDSTEGTMTLVSTYSMNAWRSVTVA
jgi:cysteine synthase